MENFKKELTYPGFSDVSERAWYEKDVRTVYEMGFMNGKPNNKFDPDGQLTVAEAITLAARVNAAYYETSFTPGGTPWYQNAVDFASDHHIISEEQFTQADYDRPATRAEVAVLLFETIGFGNYNRITYIPDVTEKTLGCNEIYLLYNAGVFTGKGTLVEGQLSGDKAGSFFPDDAVTRAEAAAIIHRVTVPSERVRFDLSGHRPGKVVNAADDSFRISIPQNENWAVKVNQVSDEGAGLFRCSQEDGGADLRIMTLPKRRWGSQSFEDFTVSTNVRSIDTWWDGELYMESANVAIALSIPMPRMEKSSKE